MPFCLNRPCVVGLFTHVQRTSSVLVHSAQKSHQKASWEFPETEIELVLTGAEQESGLLYKTRSSLPEGRTDLQSWKGIASKTKPFFPLFSDADSAFSLFKVSFVHLVLILSAFFFFFNRSYFKMFTLSGFVTFWFL